MIIIVEIVIIFIVFIIIAFFNLHFIFEPNPFLKLPYIIVIIRGYPVRKGVTMVTIAFVVIIVIFVRVQIIVI